MNERACRRCGAPTWSAKSPYCREHRPPPEERAKWATKTREARGYGSRHRALRANVERLVRFGIARCARCGEPIAPDDRWELDHAPGKQGYLGPSHFKCNRSAGGREGAAITNGRRTRPPTPKRCWSRNWNAPNPPPRDVTVLCD